MPLFSIIAIAVVMLLHQIATRAVFLWIAGRWRKISGAGFARVLVTCAVMTLAELVVALPLWAVCRYFAVRDVFLLLVLLVVALGIPWLCIRWMLRASRRQAILALLVTLVPSGAVTMLLTYVIRANFLEAFIVPTGAMAPTILGAHGEVKCSNCGLVYPVNMSHRLGDSFRRVTKSNGVCTNCGQLDEVANDTAIIEGDRILVDKAAAPRRWDLIVYDSPQDPATKYVHRLIGLPGEDLLINEGELFIDGQRLEKGPADATDLWLPVHDTAHAPREVLPQSKHWLSVIGWQANGSGWSFATAVAAEGELRFEGEITDALSYNLIFSDFGGQEKPTVWVGDVQIDCTLGDFSGDGTLAIQWDFGGLTVYGEVTGDGAVRLATGKSENLSQLRSPQPTDARGSLAKPPRRGSHLTLIVRDGKAYVGNDGVTAAVVQVVPRDVAVRPHESVDLRILAKSCTTIVERITIHRDVYYRTLQQIPDSGHWPTTIAGGGIRLGSDEFYELGDNSESSMDSRFTGPIKRNALVGVVRSIYWPPKRWHSF